jgi:hypothetical protein
MQSIFDEQSETEKVTSIPCAASAISYHPPTLANMAIELAIAEETTAKLDKKNLSDQMRGLTSARKNDLRELDLSLLCLEDEGLTEISQTNERYKLLQEIWYE